jgi:ABC-type multidrug transport system ATPase subunit
MNTVISVENLSKSYQLGVINTGTFYGDLKRWWAKKRSMPDPYQRIGEVDHGNRQGETIWALKDINLQVQQGKVLGIIGRNEAGKSTLLKILSRVAAPTSGGLGGIGRAAREPANVIEANAMGTARLMDAAQKMPHLKRFILTSSFSVYGANYTYRCPRRGARRQPP